MRINADVVLRHEGLPAVLVPYTRSHVKVYHIWMCDAELLRLTCSERLSLEEEYTNMESWRDDPTKLTFIILDAARDNDMAGDVNLYLNGDEGEGEIEVMIAERESRRCGIAITALKLMMTYANVHLGLSKFIAKVLEDNTPSIKLFEKIGFREVRRIAAFKEVHLALDVGNCAQGRAMVEEVKANWSSESYLNSSFAKRIWQKPGQTSLVQEN